MIWHKLFPMALNNTLDLSLSSLFIFELMNHSSFFFFHSKNYRDSCDGKYTGHWLLNRYSVTSDILNISLVKDIDMERVNEISF